MKIIITGASGYLGSNLVAALNSKYKVTALVRKSSCIDRLNDYKSKITRADTFAELEEVFDSVNPDVVINTVTSYGRNNESDIELITANLEYPAKIKYLCEKYNAEALINTGTSLHNNTSPYALLKNTFMKLLEFNKCEKLKCINIQLEHFYGPNNEASNFVTLVYNSCINSKELDLTAGSQYRDFIYIKDVVEAYKIILLNIKGFNNYEKVNVGSGETVKIKSLVEFIHKECKSKTKLNFGKVPMRGKEVQRNKADISMLLNLGWKVKFPLKKGIKDMIENSMNYKGHKIK